MNLSTLVLGASPNPARYSCLAIRRLRQHGHTVFAIGPRTGVVADVTLTQLWPATDVDTVTMYIGPARQPEYLERILALRPRRVIFNPGTENVSFESLLRESGIETDRACTLVMLSAGTY
jgi:predicted CoA-binding protein